MTLDAQAVADAFGLGRADDLSEVVARGELGEIRRLDTERGVFAVKHELEEWAAEGAETSTSYHRTCWEAGIPTPEPIRTTTGGFAAMVGGEQVRAYTWVDLHEKDTELEPTMLGALVARLHAVHHPWPTTTVDPWFEAPVGRAEWKGVLKAARAAGAPYVDRLAELLPALVEVEQILTPMLPLQTCHLDMWADNLRSTPSGDLCLIDFDNAGPADPSREIAMVVYEFGRGVTDQGDPARQRAVYDAYLAAGGSGRIRDRGDLALTVAQIHHIGHRHLTMWVSARDDEGRARSLAGVEEFLGEPLLMPDVDRLVEAVL